MTPATGNAIDQAQVNIGIARRLMEEGFSNGDLAVVEELISPDCVEHQRGNGPGVEGAKRVVSTLHSWFSDFRIEIEDVVANGDTVWIRNRATGTNTGRFLGFEATGRPIDITVFDVVRILFAAVAGRIREFMEVGMVDHATPLDGYPPAR